MQEHSYSVAELLATFGNCDGIIVGGRDHLPGAFIEQATRLKVISKSSIGVDMINVQAATECNVIATNAPDNYLGIVEGAVTLMLAVLKNVIYLNERTRKGQWRDFSALPTMLKDKTVGFVGFGRVAQAVADRLMPWGIRPFVCDPYLSPEVLQPYRARFGSLEDVLRSSDIVSLHVTLNEETKHLINKQTLSYMKSSAILINTSRGKVIDEAALFESLKHNQLAAAGLDVFEQEPTSEDNPLFQLDQVVASPHSIGLTDEGRVKLIAVSTSDCLRVWQGKQPVNVINP